MIKKIAKIMLPIFLIVAIATGSAYSLLETRTDKITNVFEFAYTDIEVQEPSWVDDAKTETYGSGEVVPKDPLIFNGGANEAYVYLSVFIPNELFTYKYDNVNWEYVTEHNDTVEYDGKTYEGITAYYSYKYPLASQASTTPLFETMTFATYDVDYENYLEDEEAAGNGDGSLILGQKTPVIINAYAVTTDIDDVMLENSVPDINGTCYNYGRMRAWEYFREQTENTLAASGETHRCVSAELTQNTRTVEIYDYANSKLGEVTFTSYGNETLNINFVNNYLKKFGETYAAQTGTTIPLYIDEEDMYNSINYSEGSNLTAETPIANAGDFRFNINLQYAIVNVTFVQDGTEISKVSLMFANGESITNETIAQKLADEHNINVTIEGEINEVASYEDRYELTVDVSQVTAVS